MHRRKLNDTVRVQFILTAVSQLCYKYLVILTVILCLFQRLGAINDVCQPNPCANGGTCVRPMHQAARLLNPDGPPHSTYQCLCPNGWGGQNCTDDLNDCADHPCLNGGVCENRLNMRYLCHCGPDFVGQNCEYTNPCKENPCENGGICQADILGRFTCECPQWYKGEHCEVERDPCHPVNPCQGPKTPCLVVRNNHSTTDGVGRVIDFLCECGPGYTGRYCETQEDLCAQHNCSNGGRCFYQGNQSACICPPGFYGSTCELKQIPSQKTINSGAGIVNSKSETSPNPPHNEIDWNVCKQTGCVSIHPGDLHCRADCVLNGCLELEELNDCPSWQACLTASKQDLSTSVPQSCLGRFRDGQCDAECNIPECYYDGMDCVEDDVQCEHHEFCAQHYADDKCQPQCASSACGFDGGDCLDKTLPVDPIMAPDVAESREPFLYLGTLNGSTKAFEKYRNEFLASLGLLVHGVVRIWRDSKKNSELIIDLPDSKDMKVVFAIWLCSPVQNNSQCENPLRHVTSRDISKFILSALNIGRGPKLPVALKQLGPIEESRELDFAYRTDPQWSRFLRSKEAVGIYVCLCILAGIIIILIIFLVLQRDPWHKPNKRVCTTGVWCPPVPITLKHEPRQMNRVTGFIMPSTHDPTASYKQHESLLSSYIQELHGPDYSDKCGPSVPNQESFSQSSSISMDSFTKQGKPTDTHLKRKLFDNTYSFPEENIVEPILPSSKSSFTKTQKTDPTQPRRAYRSRLPNGATDSSRKKIYRRDYAYRIAEEEQKQADEAEKRLPISERFEDQLQNVLKSKDGLHPLTAQEVVALGAMLQQNNSWSNSMYVSRQYQNEDVKRGKNGLNQASTEKPKDGSRKAGFDETLLHLAGRMNSGRDAVLCLQPTLISDSPAATVTKVDSTGRTALASAAAANALETVGAIYQLEKEAHANTRAQLSSKSQDGQTTNPNIAKSRRRQKQAEPRQPTALITAVQTGNEEVFRYLIDEGHPLNGVDEFGRNVIHWAAATNSISFLQRLVQCKGFYRLVNARDDHDRTPLMLATREGCEEAVQFLLEHKASVMTSDCTDNDPLKIARLKGFKSIENLLLNYYNPEVSSVGLTSQCPPRHCQESPFAKGTDSPSETSEFDTQSIEEEDEEEQEHTGELCTKQVCRHLERQHDRSTSGIHSSSMPSERYMARKDYQKTALSKTHPEHKHTKTKRSHN